MANVTNTPPLSQSIPSTECEKEIACAEKPVTQAAAVASLDAFAAASAYAVAGRRIVSEATSSIGEASEIVTRKAVRLFHGEYVPNAASDLPSDDILAILEAEKDKLNPSEFAKLVAKYDFQYPSYESFISVLELSKLSTEEQVQSVLCYFKYLLDSYGEDFEVIHQAVVKGSTKIKNIPPQVSSILLTFYYKSQKLREFFAHVYNHCRKVGLGKTARKFVSSIMLKEGKKDTTSIRILAYFFPNKVLSALVANCQDSSEKSVEIKTIIEMVLDRKGMESALSYAANGVFLADGFREEGSQKQYSMHVQSIVKFFLKNPNESLLSLEDIKKYVALCIPMNVRQWRPDLDFFEQHGVVSPAEVAVYRLH